MRYAWLALALVACGTPPKKAEDPKPAEKQAEPAPESPPPAASATATEAPAPPPAAPEEKYDDDFRTSLASPPHVVEADVEDDGQVTHFRVSLPASLKEETNKFSSGKGSKSWRAQRVGGFSVIIGFDEPKKFATQLTLAQSRKLVEKKETKDGWWIVGASENVVEAVRGMKTKSGKIIICRAEVLHPDAPKEKKAIFPKLRALCASLEA